MSNFYASPTALYGNILLILCVKLATNGDPEMYRIQPDIRMTSDDILHLKDNSIGGFLQRVDDIMIEIKDNLHVASATDGKAVDQ